MLLLLWWTIKGTKRGPCPTWQNWLLSESLGKPCCPHSFLFPWYIPLIHVRALFSFINFSMYPSMHLSILPSIHLLNQASTEICRVGIKAQVPMAYPLSFHSPTVSITTMAIQAAQVITPAPMSNLCPTPDRAVPWPSFSTRGCTWQHDLQLG